MAAQRTDAWTQMRALLPHGMALPRSTWDARHSFVLWVLAGHAAALPILGFQQGWSAAFSLGEPAIIGCIALLATFRQLGQTARATMAALALVGSSAIILQFAGGSSEAHLHLFVAVALIALYQSWTPLLAGLCAVFCLLALNVVLLPGGLASPEPWKEVLVQAIALAAEIGAILAFWAGAEQARARSAIVLDSASDGLLGLNGAGQVAFLNPAAERLLGKADAALGRDVRTLVPGIAEHLGQRRTRPVAASLNCLDGRVLPIEWTLSPAPGSSAGITSVLVLRDITKRQALERRLALQGQRQEFLARLGRMALETGDLAGVLAHVASNLPPLVGADTAAIKPLAAGVPATEAEADAAKANGRSVLSTTVPGPSGAWGTLAVHAARGRTFDEEDSAFLQAVAALLGAILVRHTTEAELREHKEHLEVLVQRRTAQLTEANRELEAFSYTVSHDLRSPLRALDGFSRILLQRHSDLPEESRRMLVMLSDGALRMGNLIESVLSLTRIGRASLTPRAVDLTALAHSVIKELRAKDPQRRITVRIQEGLHVEGDPGMLRLALDNLLGNAWKFTRATPHPILELTAAQRDGVWVFTVADNGAGFDMAHAHELFKPFHRLHQPSQFEGTGIGLATVSRIVKRHGGDLWAEGRVNGGARFSFTLQPTHGTLGEPLHAPTPAVAQPPAPPAPAPAVPASRPLPTPVAVAPLPGPPIASPSITMTAAPAEPQPSTASADMPTPTKGRLLEA